MRETDRPFVVGRRTSKGTTFVLIRKGTDPVQEPPIPGPWTLRAVVAPAK